MMPFTLIEDDGQRALYQGELPDGRYVELAIFTLEWSQEA